MTKVKQRGTNTSQSKSNTGTFVDTSNNMDYSTAEIPNTPFSMVYHKERGYLVRMGKHAITRWKETEAEAMSGINKMDWNTIVTVTSIVIANINEMKGEDTNVNH